MTTLEKVGAIISSIAIIGSIAIIVCITVIIYSSNDMGNRCKEEIETIQTRSKEIKSNKGVPLQDYEKYLDGRNVGYTVSYYLDKYIDENFDGDIKLGEKYKISFMKRFLEKFKMDPILNADKDRDFKIGLIEGLNFSWELRAKKIILDKKEDKIIDEVKIILEQPILPVQ